jgi:putative Mg2+ transporter-C (MgtC) family protein
MPSWINTDIVHLIIALIIGAVIGAEREYRSKSAGLRTMIMVCLGSCTFTILSLKIGIANPDRLAANIVTGIGFLGAGVIFKNDDKVTGITTATTIWILAALGMAAGSGYLLLALSGTIIVVFVLIFLVKLQFVIEQQNQIRNYKIVCDFKEETLVRYEQLFKEYNLKAERGRQSKTSQSIIGHWLVQGRSKDHELLIQRLLFDQDIKEFDF